MSIRLAQASDARAIAEVHVRSWQAAYRDLLPQEYLDGLDPGHWATRMGPHPERGGLAAARGIRGRASRRGRRIRVLLPGPR
jgi:hypothetical protein